MNHTSANPVTNPQKEKIYDYIVRRNAIINRIQVKLNILLNDNLTYDQKVDLVESTSSLVHSEFNFLTKYKFEPNKRFIQSFYNVSLGWVQTYPSKANLINDILDQCKLFGVTN